MGGLLARDGPSIGSASVHLVDQFGNPLLHGLFAVIIDDVMVLHRGQAVLLAGRLGP